MSSDYDIVGCKLFRKCACVNVLSSVPMKPYVRKNNSKFYMPSETRRFDWDEGLPVVMGTISHYVVAHISLSHFLQWDLLLTEKARW